MDKKEIKRAYFYRGLTAFLVVAACVLFFFFIYRVESIWKYVGKIISVLQPVIFGLVIAYLVNPIVNFLKRHLKKLFSKFIKNTNTAQKIADFLSVCLALIFFILIIAAIFALIIPEFVSSISNIITVLPGQIDKFATRFMEYFKDNERLEVILLKLFEYEKNWLQTDLAAYANKIASNFATGIWSVITFFKNFILGIIFALYLLLDKERFGRRFRKLLCAVFSEKQVKKLLGVLRKTDSVFSGFFSGQLLDAAVVGVLCFIGTSILQMPYSLLVAVIIGATNIIPVFGPYIGGIPCTILIMLSDPIKGLYFALFIILLQALDGNFIAPKILGGKTGLENFWVVFAIVLCGGMFGVVGMLIGVPTFAVVYYLVRTVINFRLKKKQLPVDNDSYATNCFNLEPDGALLKQKVVEEENVVNEDA